MRSLHRKLWRDLVYLKGQATAIGLVMACGVATFVMAMSMLESLKGTIETYYQTNRFADVFATLKRAPLSLADRVAEIPGVGAVETRVVERVMLDMPDMIEPAAGTIVSLPERAGDGLNLVYLRSGRFPNARSGREVLVSQRFAEAHGLQPGSGVRAILNGRLETLNVVGVALSPEYVYLIAPGAVLPEKERFAVFWMQRKEMEAAFDMEGAFNDLCLTLMPGASEAECIDRVDDLTKRYGSLGAYGRANQVSNQFLDNEIRQLSGMSIITPAIFLSVAAFLLNIVLSRIITTQREQIAALKAMGYSRWEIAGHFFGFVIIIALLAVVVGSIAGMYMGRGLTALYAEYYDFPSFRYRLGLHVLFLGALASLAAATSGVVHALKAAMDLPPAEAMRPQAPASFRPTLLEYAGLHRLVSPAVRMVLRHLERRPIKTLLSMVGIAMAAAILVVGSYTEGAVKYVLEFQFNRVNRYDIDVALADQTDNSALSTVRHFPGVLEAEPYRSVAVRIHNGHRHRRIGIQGLARDDGLFRLRDMDGRPIELPPGGLVLATTLAKVLGLSVGDTVTIEALQGRRPFFEAEVSAIIDSFSGLSAYMDIQTLNQHMHEQATMGGVYLKVDQKQLPELYQTLYDAPQVAAVNVKAATVTSFRETIAKNLGMVRGFLVGCSVIIAFGVVYNTARISLSERSRDLATLRVVGFTRREVSMIQLGELAIITVVAIPLGLAMGYSMAWATSAATASELIRIPFVIGPSTLGFAAVVVTIASFVSGMVVRRRLDRLDLVAVLKSRE